MPYPLLCSTWMPFLHRFQARKDALTCMKINWILYVMPESHYYSLCCHHHQHHNYRHYCWSDWWASQRYVAHYLPRVRGVCICSRNQYSLTRTEVHTPFTLATVIKHVALTMISLALIFMCLFSVDRNRWGRWLAFLVVECIGSMSNNELRYEHSDWLVVTCLCYCMPLKSARSR